MEKPFAMHTKKTVEPGFLFVSEDLILWAVKTITRAEPSKLFDGRVYVRVTGEPVGDATRINRTIHPTGFLYTNLVTNAADTAE